MNKKEEVKKFLKEQGPYLAFIAMNTIGMIILSKKVNNLNKAVVFLDTNIDKLDANAQVSAGAVNDIFQHLGMEDKFFIYSQGERIKGIL